MTTDSGSPQPEARGLRLEAQDEEDLRAISAALQDSVAKMGDLSYDRKARAFTAVLNRFRWEATGRAERVRTALRIDGVTRLRARGVRLDAPEAVANLLAVAFTPDAEPPGGAITLVLSGGGEIEATVECVDASMVDLTRPWRARSRPRHEPG
jgi:hypothetical protein